MTVGGAGRACDPPNASARAAAALHVGSIVGGVQVWEAAESKRGGRWLKAEVIVPWLEPSDSPPVNSFLSGEVKREG